MKKYLLMTCLIALVAISCKKDDNPIFYNDTFPEIEEKAIGNGDDLSAVINRAMESDDSVVIIKLPANIELVMNTPVVLSKKTIISGSSYYPAKVTLASGANIKTISELILQNITIDTNCLDLPLIEMGEGLPSKSKIGGILFKNVKVFNLKRQLVYGNRKHYLLDKISIDSCVIQVDGTEGKTIIDFKAGGNTSLLSIDKSTIYCIPTNAINGGLFSSQAGRSVPDLGGERQQFSITNSTLYNISYGKTISLLRHYSKPYLGFAVKNSIIFDCGIKGEFLKGLNAGQIGPNSEWDVESNAFNFTINGVIEDSHKNEIAGSSVENVRNSVLGIVLFRNAALGDFTLKECEARNAEIGDPRWLIE